MAGPIIRLEDLIDYTGLSRSAIYDRMDINSPRYAEDFPKKFPLGGKAVGWYKSDVDTWLENCAKNGGDGTPASKSKPSPNSKNIAVQAESKSSDLPDSSSPNKKSSNQPVSEPKHTDHKTPSKQVSRSVSVAKTLLNGEQINARLVAYTNMKAWTPAMGAMLISGIEPPMGCTEIPDTGLGLNGRPLHISNRCFSDARKILQRWIYYEEDEDPHILQMEPHIFLTWCMEENIKSEWMSLFLDIYGCSDEDRVDQTAAQLALLMNS